MIRNVIWMLTGFALGMLSLFMYGKMAEEKTGKCTSLIDVESIALEVRELAYVFSAAYAGMVCSEQNGYVQKLNDIKHMLGVEE